uniref:Bbp19-like phage domain-containing protein n=1 Tax=uncultured marine virus TaxID=186617 RepID=A0A0F7L406_9VIRU|nr:hypothetical protein [uncultured marine virus]
MSTTWADLTRETSDSAEDIDKLHLRVFSTEDGAKLLRYLRSVTVEQPTWYPGEDASHGYAREGQNSLVREIERRLTRARIIPDD